MRWISVVVPCRNEASHIDSFLESVFAQKIDSANYALEVVVADGLSDDGTRARLATWQHRSPELVVMDNPERITSTALNRAIERARGEIIVRMDVHTSYDSDYIAQCVRALEQTDAICVGGPWRPCGGIGLQGAISRAFSSRFGSGGAPSRRGDYSGPVDSVYLGAWRRADLVRLGGFDERLVRNQDDELNFRIRKSGGQVWQSSAIRSSYVPRASLRALFGQFYQYGYWKVPVILKHGQPASLRHLAPFTLVATLTVLGLLTPFVPHAGAALASVILLYVIALTVSAIALREPLMLGSIMLAFVCMHCGYGLGFARGLVDFALRRRGPAEQMTRLTR